MSLTFNKFVFILSLIKTMFCQQEKWRQTRNCELVIVVDIKLTKWWNICLCCYKSLTDMSVEVKKAAVVFLSTVQWCPLRPLLMPPLPLALCQLPFLPSWTFCWSCYNKLFLAVDQLPFLPFLGASSLFQKKWTTWAGRFSVIQWHTWQLLFYGESEGSFSTAYEGGKLCPCYGRFLFFTSRRIVFFSSLAADSYFFPYYLLATSK